MAQSFADAKSDDARQDEIWRKAHLLPLWQVPAAHKQSEGGLPGHIWKWKEVRPLALDAIKNRSPAAIERRVLLLADPNTERSQSTVKNITAGLQILVPGEKARPHRHSMNALRFVMEGEGATTIVDGKRCTMTQGDMILTPGWCWHEHEHQGTDTVIWLDILDFPLHGYLGSDDFEPGPVHDMTSRCDDAVFATANMVPDVLESGRSHSPVFRYPWTAAVAAVRAAPHARDEARRVRYGNPLTGGASMSLLDCYLIQIEAGRPSIPFRTSANMVCAVAEGHGQSVIGDQTIAWEPKDIFTIPQNNWFNHEALSSSVTIFVVSDRQVYQRLGLLNEDMASERKRS